MLVWRRSSEGTISTNRSAQGFERVDDLLVLLAPFAVLAFVLGCDAPTALARSTCSRCQALHDSA
jgi:hypothetical protein